MNNNRTIVFASAVVSSFPFTGKWKPCVRYEGERYAVKIGPDFQNAKEAEEYAVKLMTSKGQS